MGSALDSWVILPYDMAVNADCAFGDSLLNDPNTSSPANVEASNFYKDNRKEYVKRVRETVEKSWED